MATYCGPEMRTAWEGGSGESAVRHVQIAQMRKHGTEVSGLGSVILWMERSCRSLFFMPAFSSGLQLLWSSQEGSAAAMPVPEKQTRRRSRRCKSAFSSMWPISILPSCSCQDRVYPTGLYRPENWRSSILSFFRPVDPVKFSEVITYRYKERRESGEWWRRSSSGKEEKMNQPGKTMRFNKGSREGFTTGGAAVSTLEEPGTQHNNSHHHRRRRHLQFAWVSILFLTPWERRPQGVDMKAGK